MLTVTPSERCYLVGLSSVKNVFYKICVRSGKIRYDKYLTKNGEKFVSGVAWHEAPRCYVLRIFCTKTIDSNSKEVVLLISFEK